MPPRADQDDFLLYVLSHAGQVSWPRFKAIVAQLVAPTTSAARPAADQDTATEDTATSAEEGSTKSVTYRIQQALMWLGHCQVTFAEGKGAVYVLPPRLARLPVSGLPRAVLTGARGPDTLPALEEEAARHDATVWRSRHTTDLPAIPARIEVQAGTVENLINLAQALQFHFTAEPMAHLVATDACTVASLLHDTHWESGDPLNWQRKIFDPHQHRFTAAAVGGASLQLHAYTHPHSGILRHYLLRTRGAHSERRAIHPDWGRYVILQAHGQQVIQYDPASGVLAVPAYLPLPVELAQCLTLCSGCLPAGVALPQTDATRAAQQEKRYTLFRWIPPRIADQIASSVGQTLRTLDPAFPDTQLWPLTSHLAPLSPQ